VGDIPLKGELKVKSWDGFTLTELLIVLFIIIVLAAVVFPVLASVRRAAQTSVCISNIRQILMGVKMYSEEYNAAPTAAFDWYNFLDMGYSPPSAEEMMRSSKYAWPKVVSRYVQEKLQRCPADIGAYMWVGDPHFGDSLYERTGTSYEFLPTWFYWLRGVNQEYVLAFFDKKNPPILWDKVGFWHYQTRGVYDYSQGWEDPRRRWTHNVGFWDGRLKRLKFGELLEVLDDCHWSFNP
jgi:type II secretory pathway pseudopilin PulG